MHTHTYTHISLVFQGTFPRPALCRSSPLLSLVLFSCLLPSPSCSLHTHTHTHTHTPSLQAAAHPSLRSSPPLLGAHRACSRPNAAMARRRTWPLFSQRAALTSTTATPAATRVGRPLPLPTLRLFSYAGLSTLRMGAIPEKAARSQQWPLQTERCHLELCPRARAVAACKKYTSLCGLYGSLGLSSTRPCYLATRHT